MYLVGRDEERICFEEDEELLVATSRNAETALLLRDDDDDDGFLQLRSMGSVCMSDIESWDV